MKCEFSELVDVDRLRSLMEAFTAALGTATAIMDLDGQTIVTAGWQDICTQFHRVHPTTRAKCLESDTTLAGRVEQGEHCTLYRCGNGLVDVASPILVEGVHVANVFTGQFFLEPPDVGQFRHQAAEFGFDEAAYLEALARVPVVSREQVVKAMDFLTSFAEVVGTMGLAKKNLLAANHELSVRNHIADAFLAYGGNEAYTEVLRAVLEAVESPAGIFGYLDENGDLVCPAILGETFRSLAPQTGEFLLPRAAWNDAVCCRAITKKDIFCSNTREALTTDGRISARRHVCLPIVSRDQTVGLLVVADKAADYDPDDVRLLQAVTDYIAPVLVARLESIQRERDRRRAEEDRARLVAILEATSDFVATVTPTGQLTYVNRAARQMLGMADDEDVSTMTIARSHRPHAAGVVNHEAMPTAARQGIWRGKNMLLRRNGSEVPVSQVVMAHRGPDGRIEYYSSIMRDISDQRRAELEREKLIARLEAQNAELERFVYTVSHDLKTPLITMQGFLGALREDMAVHDEQSVGDDIERMEGATEVMSGLLRDLLELSRIGRLAYAPRNVPLGDIVRQAVELAAPAIAQRNVRIDIQRDLPVVSVDRHRLLEVFQNLIDNAVKYIGDQADPRVEIGARQRDDQWLCFVRDNGIGIEPQYQGKVFGLFEQLDPKVEGSGVGLALVKRIVEAHGGRIWVESDGAGQGSTFYFTLPAKPNAAVTPRDDKGVTAERA